MKLLVSQTMQSRGKLARCKSSGHDIQGEPPPSAPPPIKAVRTWGARGAIVPTPCALCVEMGFTRTFLGKLIETEEAKSELISIVFWYFLSNVYLHTEVFYKLRHQK